MRSARLAQWRFRPSDFRNGEHSTSTKTHRKRGGSMVGGRRIAIGMRGSSAVGGCRGDVVYASTTDLISTRPHRPVSTRSLEDVCRWLASDVSDPGKSGRTRRWWWVRGTTWRSVGSTVERVCRRTDTENWGGVRAWNARGFVSLGRDVRDEIVRRRQFIKGSPVLHK